MYVSNKPNNFRTDLGFSIFKGKYALAPEETWLQRCTTVVDDVCGTRGGTTHPLMSREERSDLVRLIHQFIFLPGGRYLYYAGRGLSFFNNCLSTDTPLVTDKGSIKMGDAVGTTVNVLSPVDGQYYPAKVHDHGVQDLYEVKLQPIQKTLDSWIQVVKATRDHRWYFADGTYTENLQVGDKIPANVYAAPHNEEAWLHGFFFGDGNNGGQLRLCGTKGQYAERFESFGASITAPPSAKGDKMVYVKGIYTGELRWKELPPDSADASYRGSFVRGLLAADGSKKSTGTWLLENVDKHVINWFLENAQHAGLVPVNKLTRRIQTKTIGTYTYKDHVTYIGKADEAKDFRGFKVVSIDYCGTEPVCCPDEPVHHQIVVHNGIHTGNCYLFKGEEDTREEWSRLLHSSSDALMSGGGIGIDYSIFRPRGSLLRRTGGTACLTGDTIVYKDRKKSSEHNSITIKYLHDMQEQKPDKFKHIKLRCLDEVSGKFYRNQLLGVVYNGEAPVYEVTTQNGYKIKATSNHRFMSDDRSYQELNEFAVGDSIAVNGTMPWVPVDTSKPFRKHPCVECGSAVAKAGALCFNCREKRPCPQCGGTRSRKAAVCFNCACLNQQKEDASETTARQRRECRAASKNYCEVCNVHNVRFEIHHKDKNPKNNEADNLINLCSSCHSRLHVIDSTYGNAYSHKYVSFDTIESIVQCGVEPVYDLQMKGPNHNFVANGFVSHNSGPIPLAISVNEHGRNVKQGGCLPGYTRVAMANNTTKRIDAIVKGDMVATRFGPKAVTTVFDQGVQPVFEIKTTDGTVIATKEHRWLSCAKDRQKRWRKVKKMEPGNKLYRVYTPVEGSVHASINYAYTMGYYMGNGCAYSSNRTHEITFNLPDKWISDAQLDRIKEVMTELGTNPIVRQGHGACKEIRCRSKELVPVFQAWKSPNQPVKIPQEVFLWNLEARRAFIAGWYDSDGSSTTDAWRISNKWMSTIEELGDLLFSMGFKTSTNKGESVHEIRISSYQRAAFTSEVGRYMFKALTSYDKATTEIPTRILSVKELPPEHTYDLEIDDVHEFIADGFVSHNSRRSAIYASLNWQHGDVKEWLYIKDWANTKIPGTDVTYAQAKVNDFDAHAPLDFTNISLNYDNAWIAAMVAGVDDDEMDDLSWDLAMDQAAWSEIANNAPIPATFLENTRMAMRNGEPGFSFNFFDKENETARNACTEVTSEDDSDMCNIGSVNMAACSNKATFERACELGSKFLICGTIRGTLPDEKTKKVREKNRRIGLGLMGVHEWLLQRGFQYKFNPELHEWMGIYRDTSIKAANEHCDRFYLSRPVAMRALAPTGCQRSDTMVVTSQGILPLYALKDGSEDTWQDLNVDVATDRLDAKATRLFINGKADTVKITTKSGNWLEATPNHKYRVIRDGKYEWIRSDNLVIGDALVVKLGGYNKTTELKLVGTPAWHGNQQAITFPTRMTPSLAKWLGMYYSNGSTHNKGIRIHHNALETHWEEAESLSKEVFGVCCTTTSDRNCKSVCLNSNRLLWWLDANELTKPKARKMKFPEAILRSSKQSIEAFIEGYKWGDGSHSGSTEYIDSSSRRFIQELQVVSRALGQDMSIRSRTSGMGFPMYRGVFVKTHRKDEQREHTAVLAQNGLETCTVDLITKLDNGHCMTLDLEVPGPTTYIANGVVSHNTIGTLAGTTTGIEPVFAVAYKRRYLEGNRETGAESRKFQYFIDTGAQNLIDEYGISPDSIESAMDLAKDPERRIAFQADIQDYVDMGISSTLNLPQWGTVDNNDDLVESFARTIAKYAPRLRGLTMYPDGSRGGQPLVAVPYEQAIEGGIGIEFEENSEKACKSGVCGI